MILRVTVLVSVVVVLLAAATSCQAEKTTCGRALLATLEIDQNERGWALMSNEALSSATITPDEMRWALSDCVQQAKMVLYVLTGARRDSRKIREKLQAPGPTRDLIQKKVQQQPRDPTRLRKRDQRTARRLLERMDALGIPGSDGSTPGFTRSWRGATALSDARDHIRGDHTSGRAVFYLQMACPVHGIVVERRAGNGNAGLPRFAVYQSNRLSVYNNDHTTMTDMHAYTLRNWLTSTSNAQHLPLTGAELANDATFTDWYDRIVQHQQRLSENMEYDDDARAGEQALFASRWGQAKRRRCTSAQPTVWEYTSAHNPHMTNRECRERANLLCEMGLSDARAKSV